MVVSHGPGNHGEYTGNHGNYKPVVKSEEERKNLGRLQGKESLITSTISLFVDENQPFIPDGGWGWFVMLAAFFINLVSDGITCCFGLLYKDFLVEFGASKSATSWIGSLYVAVPLVGGPLGSALVDKYGCKKMTIVGALISTVGFILSTYARNILVMYITFGFLGGIGLALCYVTAVVAIAFWFDKKRTLALGLSAAGCGFGTVIYSPLITLLSREYSWRGTVLILAGLFLNMVVCGLLQRDPEWIIKQERQRLNEEEKAKDSEELQPKNRKISTEKYILDHIRTFVDIKQKDRFHSTLNLPTYIDDHKEVPLEVLKNLSNDKHIYKIILDNYPNLLSNNNRSDTNLDKLAAEASLVKTRVPVKYSMTVKKSETTAYDIHKNEDLLPLTKIGFPRAKVESNGQLQHGYMANMRLRKRDSINILDTVVIPGYKVTESCPNISSDMQVKSIREMNEEMKEEKEGFRSISDIIDFSMFLELHFFLVSVATVIMCVWFAVPFVYLPVHMENIGYSDYDTSVTISFLGVTNILGMVIIGFLGTKIEVATLYATCLILSGASCAAMMLFSSNYAILLISTGSFGLFYASQHSLTPAIVAQLVPLDKFSMAYGLSLLCQGIGKLIGPPLAGWIFDMTHSFSQSFYQAAFWIIVAGVLIGVIPYTKNRKFWCR